MINYDILNKQEQNTKIFRDLYTVFVSSGNKGLTDTEIYNEIIRLKISGYNSKNPECIIRGNISRWNTSSIKHQNGKNGMHVIVTSSRNVVNYIEKMK